MRRPDWQRQLITTIEAARVRPFVWGENDCCLFVADCCMAASGVDPAAVYRGRYTTAIGAQRVLNKEHGSIAAVLDAHFPRIEPALAQRGDPVVFDGPLGQTAGVMWAGQVWAMTETGARPIHDVAPLFAWRV
ncbi:hypothetical protein KAM344_17450 [Aeromonas caviae]|nr:MULTISPECIES: hypothetical protein [Aeromonas]APJ15152.1 hypothetical protein BOQ57_09550 [Aeromonas hydrophila]ELO1556565.1 hypothetical protein [Aeromonas hydrophila]GJB74852.1 hypothetical protein KAM379_39100 [Aeromonas caviae]GKQ66580.1 hypothetical protein KAM344_17450 [Aeromonas caviae]